MFIERSGFLLIAGALAAGGVGGWYARDSKAQTERAAQVPPPAVTVAPEPKVVVIDRTPPPPVCDDSVGVLEDCPAMGPADEGVCSNLAAKRCAEFKVAFKPKVAQAAVSCLKNLKGNALCDASRVNLCGHSALMAACSEAPPTLAAGDAGVAEPPSPLSVACDHIVKSYAGPQPGPTLADCRQTLSGMTDAGRASMVECMASHSADKGLLGCEAVKKI